MSSNQLARNRAGSCRVRQIPTLRRGTANARHWGVLLGLALAWVVIGGAGTLAAELPAGTTSDQEQTSTAASETSTDTANGSSATVLPQAEEATKDREQPAAANQTTEKASDSVSEEVPVGITAKELLDWIPAEKVSGSLHLAVSMTILGLVPALLLMTTCYVRISVVLALLRQAFGIPNLLPMQATTALALFCTGWIMWPTWQLVHRQAVVPIVAGQSVADPDKLWLQGMGPIRDFMVRQIEANHNADDVHLFLQKSASEGNYPTSYDEVPLAALLPAFLLSELKTAFIIGFKIYLPFLVIDLVVSAITTSMGLFMMPPSMLSMPLKLLLFVLVDGWHLVVEMLLHSFQ